MSWFKVDDQLPDHRKVRRLGVDRLSAMGLWALCGAWSSKQTDGFVPDEVVTRYDPEHMFAKRLCEVDLWEVAEVDGESGYLFHDWLDYRPSQEQEQKKREDTRRRVQAHRGRKRAEQGKRDSHGRYEAAEHPNPDPSASSYDEECNALQHLDCNEECNPPPEPEPEPEKSSSGSPLGGGSGGSELTRKRSSQKRGTRLPEDWRPHENLRDWFLEKCPKLNERNLAGEETEKFRRHWWSKAGKDGTKLDWNMTWQNWMVKAERDLPEVSTSSRGRYGKPTASERAQRTLSMEDPERMEGRTA